MEKSYWANCEFWYNNNKKYTVIGVVKDYHYSAIKPENRSAVIYHEE